MIVLLAGTAWLGLVAWLYLAAEITVYCAEINVVLARRLWPRSIIQPPLTEADRASLAVQALQNQRRQEQQVVVTFDDRQRGVSAAPTTPRTPDEISPPAPRTPEPDEETAPRAETRTRGMDREAATGGHGDNRDVSEHQETGT